MNNNRVTHKLDYKDTAVLGEYYDIEEVFYSFKKVLSVDRKGKTTIVTGIREVYGYPIADGFFDTNKLLYYPKESSYIKEGIISAYKPDIVKTKVKK